MTRSVSGDDLPAIVEMDCRRLPLRPGCVDVLIADLPFGNRSGSKSGNQYCRLSGNTMPSTDRKLYPRALTQFAKVLGPDGRGLVMSSDGFVAEAFRIICKDATVEAQQISNLASAHVSRAEKNTENRTGTHIASILAISLSFPERSRVHLG